jgi:imidazoleglycerol-phosphate dehydratase
MNSLNFPHENVLCARLGMKLNPLRTGRVDMAAERKGTVERSTKETQIYAEFMLDGAGRAELDTGVPFLDHMLTLFAVHGLFDLKVQATGDLAVDAHHTVEDIGICLGMALTKALGDRAGIVRYGQFTVPMDEALAAVALDLSNRPFLVYNISPMADRVGDFETELAPEFFRAFCQHGGVTLHISVPYGNNTHHMLEAAFKAWGRALAIAVSFDPRRSGIPSSKGAL